MLWQARVSPTRPANASAKLATGALALMRGLRKEARTVYAAVMDRNQRARLMFRAEALDRRTRLPGQHGGVLKRTGLAVLKALLFGFHNAATGRCDPGFEALARLAGVARSTVAVALARLERAGLIARTRRQSGAVRLTNAYAFGASGTAWSGSRTESTNRPLKPETARSGPAAGRLGDRVRGLLGALERRERRLGLAP